MSIRPRPYPLARVEHAASFSSGAMNFKIHCGITTIQTNTILTRAYIFIFKICIINMQSKLRKMVYMTK